MSPQIVQLKCPNPGCGNVVSVKRPDKPGRYKVTCPRCGAKIPLVVEVKPRPVPPSPPVPPGPPNDGSQNPPEKMLPGKFSYGKPARIQCAFDCGYIHEEIPSHTGLNKFQCPVCRRITKYEVSEGTIIIDNDRYQAFRGKLIMLRRGWFNKEFRLNPGPNIVGRYDSNPSGNSDIAISDDPSMSRRSIDIRVEYNDIKGYTFQLKVLRATNPVLINHEPLMAGECFSLNFGDSIILGKTQFRFDKDV